MNEALEGLPENIRRGTERILEHTRRRAPFMLGEVVMRLRRHYFEIAKLPSMRQVIDKEIEVEESGTMTYCFITADPDYRMKAAPSRAQLVNL